MALILLILFIGVPILEIALFIEIGGWIGLWPTILIVIATAFAGTTLLRAQGLATLARAQESLARNEAPVVEAFDGMCLLLAGILLLTPGFATDTAGLLLFVPAVRHAIMGWLWKRLRASEGFHVYAARTTRSRAGDSVIEGEYEEVGRTPGTGPSKPVHPRRINGDHS
jgi:UPF0716 protein FxsA